MLTTNARIYWRLPYPAGARRAAGAIVLLVVESACGSSSFDCPYVRFRPIADIRTVPEKAGMSYSKDTLVAAHKHSIRHRAELGQSDVCGCFCCGETYPPTEIED